MVDHIRTFMARAAMADLPVHPSILADRAPLVGALGEALNRLHAGLFGAQSVRPEISLTKLVGATSEGN
jgi:hypothetical protein